MILGLCHFLNSRLNSIDLFEDVCPIKAKKGHTNVLAGLEILAIRKRRNDIPISMKMLKGILIDVFQRRGIKKIFCFIYLVARC